MLEPFKSRVIRKNRSFIYRLYLPHGVLEKLIYTNTKFPPLTSISCTPKYTTQMPRFRHFKTVTQMVDHYSRLRINAAVRYKCYMPYICKHVMMHVAIVYCWVKNHCVPICIGMNTPGRHAELMALDKYRSLHRNIKRDATPPSLLVWRTNWRGKVVNSKPCKGCVSDICKSPVDFKHIEYSDDHNGRIVLVQSTKQALLQDTSPHEGYLALAKAAANNV